MGKLRAGHTGHTGLAAAWLAPTTLQGCVQLVVMRPASLSSPPLCSATHSYLVPAHCPSGTAVLVAHLIRQGDPEAGERMKGIKLHAGGQQGACRQAG